MPEKLTEFDAAEYIETEEDALHHLRLCADEDPGDGSVIRMALASVVRARNASQIARAAGLDRSVLYKALTPERDPAFSTVSKIVTALGLRLRLEPSNTEANSSTP